MKLAGKSAIVTGAGRDIGAAVALKLASEGANVAINYFASSAGAEDVVAKIKADGGTAFALQGDLTQKSDVDALVARSLAEFGSIDVLVNNAGGLVARKTVAESSLEHWKYVMDLNLTSNFMMTNACLAHMKSGAIVNLASQAARDGGGPGSVPYATSKGAIMTFTRGMAKELGPKGIRVNCVCPGMISTTFHDTFTKDEVRKTVAAGTPLRREGQADEVADLVTYLASDESSFLTGTSVDINGGLAFS